MSILIIIVKIVGCLVALGIWTFLVYSFSTYLAHDKAITAFNEGKKDYKERSLCPYSWKQEDLQKHWNNGSNLAAQEHYTETYRSTSDNYRQLYYKYELMYQDAKRGRYAGYDGP